MSIGIIGAGAFGTALAISLSRNGPVDLWSRSPDKARDMQKTRENTTRLLGAALPDTLTVSSNLSHVAQNRVLLLAVPMQQLRSVLAEFSSLFEGHVLVACCKGIELKTSAGPMAVMDSVISGASFALLTGPSFAHDIALGLPTALTLACSDPALAHSLQHELTTDNLRLYRTSDVVGAELGGALKNVVAIACGAVIGAGLGDSARAALMTRGYAEMQRMAVVSGARAETLAGLSGFGDLALTCTSEQSRNYQLGLSLGRGELFDPNVTVEGAATARAVAERCEDLNLDMPITQSVVALLDGKLTITDAMTNLLARPLKEE